MSLSTLQKPNVDNKNQQFNEEWIIYLARCLYEKALHHASLKLHVNIPGSLNLEFQ